MEFSLLLEAGCELAVPGWQSVCGMPQVGGGQGLQVVHPGRGLGKTQRGVVSRAALPS